MEGAKLSLVVGALSLCAWLNTAAASPGESSSPGDRVVSTSEEALPAVASVPDPLGLTRGTVRISFRSGMFQESDFTGADDELSALSHHIAFSYEFSRRFSANTSVSFSTYTGPALNPDTIQAFGDLDVSVLGVPFRGEALGAGLRLGGHFLSSEQGPSGYGKSASPYLDLSLAHHLGALSTGASLGYQLDRTAAIVESGIALDPAQRAAYGVADADFVRASAGIEVRTLRDHLVPFISYRGRIYSGLEDSPHLVGGGLRFALKVLSRTVALTTGADWALSGMDPEPARPRVPQLGAYVQLSLAAPPVRIVQVVQAPAPPRIITRKEKPTTGTVQGKIVDAESGEPLSEATITFLDTDRNPILTDNFGRFRLGEFPQGTLLVQVTRRDYEPALPKIIIAAGQTTPLEVKLHRYEKSKMGNLRIQVKDRSTSQPVTAMILVTGPDRKQEVATDSGGVLQIAAPPGRYKIRVKASGYLAQSGTYELPPGGSAGGVLLMAKD